MKRKRSPLFLVVLASPLAMVLVAACGWNPKQPFVREAPAVKQAITMLASDGGAAPAASAAAQTIEDYLSTGPCKDGNIGTPDLVTKRPDGTFDLGLALFRVGESFGRRFGDEEVDAGVTEAARQSRHSQLECALRLVRMIGRGESLSPSARAETYYLEGNLNFLDAAYEEAVAAYDKALAIAPGLVDAGLAVGRDAAFNRAIALRRIDDEKNRDAGHDSGSPEGGGGDGGGGEGDSGSNKDNDAGSPSKPDAGNGAPDAGQDGSPNHGKQDAAEPPPEKPDAGGPPPSVGQDDRVLDMLENSAPTVQQEEAKQRAGNRHVRGSADR